MTMHVNMNMSYSYGFYIGFAWYECGIIPHFYTAEIDQLKGYGVVYLRH